MLNAQVLEQIASIYRPKMPKNIVSMQDVVTKANLTACMGTGAMQMWACSEKKLRQVAFSCRTAFYN